MSSQTFYSYVCNTLLPHLKQKGVKLPILYLLDGHKSHLTYYLSKFCAENGIFLFALYPNATHILQPADVSLFAPLKNNWKNIVFNWKKQNNNKVVNKATFPSLLENAMQQISEDTVKNGFRKCGLFPFNVEAIDFKKCMADSSRIFGEKQNESTRIKPIDFEVPHFLYFESVIPAKRRLEFQNSEMGEWEGDESAKELYEVWKKLKTRCKKNSTEEQDIPEIGTEETSNIEIADIDQEGIEPETDENITTIDGTEDEKADISEVGTEENANMNTLKANEIEPKNDTNINTIDGKLSEPDQTEIDQNKNSTTNIETETCDKYAQGKLIENLKEKRVHIVNNIVVCKPSTSRGPKNIEPEVLSPKSLRPISASFVDHIFWPEESPEKKESVSKKERLPHATTSLRWLKFHEEKEKIKADKEKAKLERAILRKSKREENTKKSQNRNARLKKRSKICKKLKKNQI